MDQAGLSRPWRSWPIATRSSSARRRATATWPPRTDGLWAKGVFNGKVGSSFTSTASPHGGQESTILATNNVLYHFGMVVVGLPYSYAPLTDATRVQGGTPYGASTIAGGDGSLQPTGDDLGAARFQGAHVAGVAARLAA
jgi:NAD(P)H dehydrogenase (quinone)